MRVNGKRYGLYLELETYDDISHEAPVRLDAAPLRGRRLRRRRCPGRGSAYQVEEGDEDERQRPRGPDRRHQRPPAATGRTAWQPPPTSTRSRGCWPPSSSSATGTATASVDPAPTGRTTTTCTATTAGASAMLPSGPDQTFVVGDPFPGKRRGGCWPRTAAPTPRAWRPSAIASATSPPPPTRCRVGARLDVIAATVARWRPCADLERASDPAVADGGDLDARVRPRSPRRGGSPTAARRSPARDPLLDATAPPALSSAGCRSTAAEGGARGSGAHPDSEAGGADDHPDRPGDRGRGRDGRPRATAAPHRAHPLAAGTPVTAWGSLLLPPGSARPGPAAAA